MLNEENEGGSLARGDVLEALADLERNTPEEIRQMRSHARITISCKVTARPGNSEARLAWKAQGLTVDISSGGCQAVFPVPARVGNIYWLRFSDQLSGVGSIFARCVRCRLVREDAFEAGFSFFVPVDVSGALEEDTCLLGDMPSPTGQHTTPLPL